MTPTGAPRPVRWPAAAAAAALVVGVLLLVPAGAKPPGPAGAPAPTAASTPTPRAAPTPPTPTGPGDPPAQPSEPGWRATVDGFAADFATLGAGHHDWWTRVSRWTSRHLSQQYRDTDPTRIPTAAVAAVDTLTVGDYTADVLVRYDTGLTLACRVELEPEGWKITATAPKKEDQPPRRRA